MSNQTFKVISRFRDRDKQASWSRGIPGRQDKKRVYTSKEDFDKHSPKIIKRWSVYMDVECYELIEGKWWEIKEENQHTG